MAQQLAVQTEMKSPADKFYGFFKSNMSNLVQLFPENFKTFELVEGNDYSTGSVIFCKYLLGSLMTIRAKIEAADDENKSITFCALEGDIMNLYKSFKVTLQAIKEGDGVGSVKWSFEFEKANEAAPNPDVYAALVAKVSKGLDTYLCNI
ncbi:hypothetical protein L1049_002734 [Liquidambar formosana]|uniref:Bet v I/Major latex protein domain-containing protein n=1 Tax=Liquidambar formosana TaxID=63359 RepID=A0AAP0NGL4_LIQFO